MESWIVPSGVYLGSFVDSPTLHACVMNQKLIQFTRYGRNIVVLW